MQKFWLFHIWTFSYLATRSVQIFIVSWRQIFLIVVFWRLDKICMVYIFHWFVLCFLMLSDGCLSVTPVLPLRLIVYDDSKGVCDGRCSSFLCSRTIVCVWAEQMLDVRLLVIFHQMVLLTFYLSDLHTQLRCVFV